MLQHRKKWFLSLSVNYPSSCLRVSTALAAVPKKRDSRTLIGNSGKLNSFSVHHYRSMIVQWAKRESRSFDNIFFIFLNLIPRSLALKSHFNIDISTHDSSTVLGRKVMKAMKCFCWHVDRGKWITGPTQISAKQRVNNIKELFVAKFHN